MKALTVISILTKAGINNFVEEIADNYTQYIFEHKGFTYSFEVVNGNARGFYKVSGYDNASQETRRRFYDTFKAMKNDMGI